MLNQGQGTYPQLAGSFYNSAQMMPHDNGRNAQQVPTFFGGLQNTISASQAMHNYQGIPLNQSILGTQALAHHQYGQGLANTIGGIGTGLGVVGLVGGIGGAVAKTMGGSGLLMKTLGVMGGMGVAGVGAGVMATMHVYNKRMRDIEDMRNAMEGSRLGYGLADPITGGLSNTGAINLSRQMEYAAAGAGFRGSDDLKKVMGQASGLGMLNGMQSLGEVTKRVTDLAKASREIVMLGEGISMTDAMQLQKLTQDMGISTSKFRGMNIGKNLVMAARAAGMSMDEAAQVGGQGAMTFQQMGLGAASGMNAAFFSNIAARGLTGVGAFSQRQLAALGGERGIAQNLLMGQAGTMGRLSDTMIAGAVKLGGDGQFRIDREMLDRYIRGDISLREMQERGRDIGKGMTKGQRARLLEGLNYAMPELKEQVSDMLTSEEMMTIQGREILNLRKRTGMSMKRAAQTYFGDAAQAETFLGYAQNYRATRAEQERQRRIADNEQMLKYAGMAKSSSIGARIGRGLVSAAEATGDFLMSIPTTLGEGLASQVQRMQDARNRGLKTILGLGDSYGGVEIDTGATIYGGVNRGRENFLAYDGGRSAVTSTGIMGGRYSSYSDMARTLLTNPDGVSIDRFLNNVGLTRGLNEFGGGGLGQRLTQYREGDYSVFGKLGDYLGLEGSRSQQAQDPIDASSIVDDSIQMGRLIQGNNTFDYQNIEQRSAFRKALQHLRKVSVAAEAGEGSGYAGGVDSSAMRVSTLRGVLKGFDKETQDAAMAQAYRYAQSAGGKFSIGFNQMLTETAGVAGLMQLGQDSITERLDGLRLEGGGFLEAKGLSSALAQSGMRQSDVQQLVRGLVENRDEIMQEGAGRPSTEGILRKLRISRHRYKNNMGGVRRVIDALLQGQITRGSGKDKKTFGLKEAFAEGISLDLAGGAVGSSIDADTRRRLTALDTEIGKNLGDGGEYLRGDIYSGITLSTSNAGDLERAYRFSAQQAGELDEDSVSARAERIRMSRHREATRRLSKTKELLSKAQQRLTDETVKNDFDLNRENVDKAQAEVDRLKAEIGKHTDSQKFYARDIGRTGGQYQKHLSEAAREAIMTDYKRFKGKDEVVDEYTRERRSLLSRSGTLSEALQDLAEEQITAMGLTGDEKKKALEDRRTAYSNLMKGIAGTELETEFKAARSQFMTIMDPAERRQKELELMKKIIEKARAQGIEGIPGAEKSKSLPAILEEIAGGITEFKKAMQAVSNITNDGGVLKIQLPPPK